MHSRPLQDSLQGVQGRQHLLAQSDSITVQRMQRGRNLCARQTQNQLQTVWGWLNMRTQSREEQVQRLRRKPDLQARAGKVRALQFNSHGIPLTRRSPQVQLQAVQGQGILRSRQKTHRTVQGLLRTVRKNAGSGGYRRSKGTLQTQDSTDCHCSKGAPCA